MKLVSEMCPDIQDMLFMYQDMYTCKLDVLANFKNLQNIELWGGDFYVDNFMSMIESIGPSLVKLDLHHVDNIDFRAISLISFICQKLKYLRLGGCGLIENINKPTTFTIFLSVCRHKTALYSSHILFVFYIHSF